MPMPVQAGRLTPHLTCPVNVSNIQQICDPDRWTSKPQQYWCMTQPNAQNSVLHNSTGIL
ncbi:hypothetical protein ACTZ9G_000065 [Acinetobacter baumannii]|nr:hypothetical protein [Acinetobacter baumannii]EKT9385395.1 hypothetical protein [Acinetobacter baumannii]EKT9860402.1 hypothetical protein [Acinetobacter baumannii]EKT9864140.1 hypothetical protein [Acinetobacter baumannii]EKT9905159.1 hypothetical protein [Acinetobacter baumannii]